MLAGLPLDTLALPLARRPGRRHRGRRHRFRLRAGRLVDLAAPHRPAAFRHLLITGCGVLLHLTTIWQQRQHVEIGRVWPFVVGGLIGIPIGVLLLAHTDAGILKVVLGVFLRCLELTHCSSPTLATVTGGGRAADVGIGFIGGILGGLGGYSGVLPTIWTQLRGWPKEMARAVYQPYVIVMQVDDVGGYHAGDVRLDRPDAAGRGAAAAAARNLDRLAALRPARRPALSPGAGRAADRLRR